MPAAGGCAGFNPRARTGRDSPRAKLAPYSKGFNPRARTGRDALSRTRKAAPPCFNPRARTGRDLTAQYAKRISAVSTHAPARGATRRTQRKREASMFQPTRPHGARRLRSCCARKHPQGFNPRARTGRDVLSAQRLEIQGSFNPRARTGRDATNAKLCRDFKVSFNPRARTGRDLNILRRHAYRVVSTHAPARGATAALAAQKPLSALFQPTRPHGARPLHEARNVAARVFQPTRPHGARQCRA